MYTSTSILYRALGADNTRIYMAKQIKNVSDMFVFEFFWIKLSCSSTVSQYSQSLYTCSSEFNETGFLSLETKTPTDLT